MDPTASVDWGAVGAVAPVVLAVTTGGLALMTWKMASETRNLVTETKRTRDEEETARRPG